jgi:photosystem II stability/assembly factor-like uncharacterized protein
VRLLLPTTLSVVVALLLAGCGNEGADVWAVGESTTVYASCDGGVHWQGQQLGWTSRVLTDVSFADSRHGWAVGSDTFMTTDGGRHWSSSESMPSSDMSAVASLDATDAWAVGTPGSEPSIYQPFVAATEGGNDNWTQRSLPTNPYAPNACTDVAFGDRLHGWIVGDWERMCFGTIDGGFTWKAQTLDRGAGLSGVAAVGATHAWVVGADAAGHPLIESTTDGNTWTSRRLTGKYGLLAVAFADQLHGWAVGGLTESVLATVDGGVHWTLQHVPNRGKDPQPISDVAATDARHAWVVSGFRVFRTSDGGATWVLAGRFPVGLLGIAALPIRTAMPKNRVP